MAALLGRINIGIANIAVKSSAMLALSRKIHLNVSHTLTHLVN